MFRAPGVLIAVLLAGGVPITVRAAGTADVSIAVAGLTVADQGTSVRFAVSYANAGPEAATNLTVVK